MRLLTALSKKIWVKLRIAWAIIRGKPDGSAGTKSTFGYWQIVVSNRSYFAHRLAWLYEYGQWPAMFLDHVDGNKVNNAISNLREVTHKENMSHYWGKHRFTHKSGINRVPHYHF
jgi:hypothetical protein